MAVDIHRRTAHDRLSLAELALYHDIMDYRASQGLAPIPLSKALTTTAGRHVVDGRGNMWPQDPDFRDLHDWSDARYHREDGAPEAMWFAPDRLGTGYADPGYEISAAGSEDAGAALDLWKDSPAHDAILTNSGRWDDRTFRAIGIGVENRDGPGDFAGRIYHVWFGEARDPSGAPAIRGTRGADRIEGTAFADRIAGREGPDLLRGGAGPDRLLGGPGSDRLKGGAGGDVLKGGTGADVYSGGPGADRFVFAAAAHAGLGRSRDRIEDFQPGRDRIDLSGIDARGDIPGQQDFDFADAAPFDGAGSLRYVAGIVAADTTGDDRPDFHIELAGKPALTADDFLL